MKSTNYMLTSEFLINVESRPKYFDISTTVDFPCNH